MRCTPFSLRGLAAALLCGAALGAQAQVSVSAIDASGLPGGVAVPGLTFTFGGSYAVLSFDLEFNWDPALLTFAPLASTVGVDGTTVAFATVAAGLPGLAVNSGIDAVTGRAFYDISYIATGAAPTIDSVLTFNPGFTIAGTATPGTTTLVSFSGALADDLSGIETPFALDATVSITAVPEPATWLAMCGGLLALGGVARRRRAD